MKALKHYARAALVLVGALAGTAGFHKGPCL